MGDSHAVYQDMDALAASESLLHASSDAPSNDKTEEQKQEENKFQRAISAWRGMNSLI